MIKIICYTGVALFVLSVLGLVGVGYIDIWELLNKTTIEKLYDSFTASLGLGFLVFLFSAPHTLKDFKNKN